MYLQVIQSRNAFPKHQSIDDRRLLTVQVEPANPHLLGFYLSLHCNSTYNTQHTIPTKSSITIYNSSGISQDPLTAIRVHSWSIILVVLALALLSYPWISCISLHSLDQRHYAAIEVAPIAKEISQFSIKNTKRITMP